MPPVIPGCQGMARFDTEKQAAYVAQGHTYEFGTVFTHVAHENHWHVIDTGQAPPKEPDRPDTTQGTDHA